MDGEDVAAKLLFQCGRDLCLRIQANGLDAEDDVFVGKHDLYNDTTLQNVLIDDYNNYAITDFGISSQRGGKHGFYFDEDNFAPGSGYTEEDYVLLYDYADTKIGLGVKNIAFRMDIDTIVNGD